MDDGGGNGTSSLRVEVRTDAAKLTNVVITGFGNRRNLVGGYLKTVDIQQNSRYPKMSCILGM